MKFFSLRKKERIKLRREFQQLFENQKFILVGPLKVTYFFSKTEKPIVKVSFSVPSKLFKKSVKRNYIKRLLRETYRKNKYILYESLNFKVLLNFSYIYNDFPNYKFIEENMIHSLQILKDLIKNNNENV